MWQYVQYFLRLAGCTLLFAFLCMMVVGHVWNSMFAPSLGASFIKDTQSYTGCLVVGLFISILRVKWPEETPEKA